MLLTSTDPFLTDSDDSMPDDVELSEQTNPIPTHVQNNGWQVGTSCLSILLKDEIELMMNELCEEHGVTNRYSIQQFDFSSLISN